MCRCICPSCHCSANACCAAATTPPRVMPQRAAARGVSVALPRVVSPPSCCHPLHRHDHTAACHAAAHCWPLCRCCFRVLYRHSRSAARCTAVVFAAHRATTALLVPAAAAAAAAHHHCAAPVGPGQLLPSHVSCYCCWHYHRVATAAGANTWRGLELLWGITQNPMSEKKE